MKYFWYLNRQLQSRFRLLFFRLLSGSYFKSVGRSTQFFGWPNFGTVEGNISVGENCMIGSRIFFSAGKACEIKIGNNCSINTGCLLVALYGISIGNGTRIGEYCSIRDQNHGISDSEVSVADQGYTGGPITIGENCWIGRGVFIGPGVTIGEGAVVGANAVVVKDVEPFTVVGGVPAKLIRKRKP